MFIEAIHWNLAQSWTFMSTTMLQNFFLLHSKTDFLFGWFYIKVVFLLKDSNVVIMVTLTIYWS